MGRYDGAFASLYFIFAIIFAIANVMTQDVGPRSDIYKAVTTIYTSTPYRNNPDKFFKDISTPDDLYTWFQFVFVPVTFTEQPAPGDSNGFCLEQEPCYIDEGDCDNDDQCTDDLTCKSNTAPELGKLVHDTYWDTAELIEWCEYMGTPVNASQTTQDCDTESSATFSSDSSSKGPCCWDPHARQPIVSIESVPADTQMDEDLQIRQNCPSSMEPGNDCCTVRHVEPLTPNQTARRSTEDNEQKFAATVGNFNRLVYTRFTMKRYVLDTNPYPYFSDLSFSKLRGDGVSLSPDDDNGNLEDRQPFNDWRNATVYQWQKKGSFAQSGGYSKVFPRVQTQQQWATFVEKLSLDKWFDARMGSAALELMFYNGNADTFMYLNFIWQFDFAGTCTMSIKPYFINLNSMSLEGRYAVPQIIEKILIGLVLFFFLYECYLMRTSVGYFSKPAKLVDLFSLALCTTVLSLNYVISLNSSYTGFEFTTLLQGSDSQVTDFIAGFVDLLNLVQWQTTLIAVNMLMIFIRAVMLVTQLEGQLGLITNTLAAAFSRLCFFFFQYMLLLVGFVAFAYFTFGQYPEESGMTDLAMTFYIIFAMLVGLSKREDLTAADATMTPIFLMTYYVVTVFVMQNMFVSILLSGYDQVLEKLMKREREKGKDLNFLVKIYMDYRDMFRIVWMFFAKCVGFIWYNGLKYIFDGLTSCFVECLAACDCGCPNPFKACLNCLRACRRPKREIQVSQEMLEKENEESKKQLRKGERCMRDVKDDPNAVQSLNMKMVALQDAKRKVDLYFDELKRTGPNEDAMKDYYIEMHDARLGLKDQIFELKQTASLAELLVMAVFLSTFIGMMILLVSMGNVYLLQESSLNPVLDKYWNSPGTLKTTGFDGIQSFEDVGEWSFAAVVGLYLHMECRRYPGTATPHVSLCSNANNNEQLVNTVNKWNIGFLNTTFVRVTIQPACFIDNPKDRWRHGVSLLRSKEEDGSCPGEPCFDEALQTEGTCMNSVGEEINVQQTYVQETVGSGNQIIYNYSEKNQLGPYSMTGGFTVSLGTSVEECRKQLQYLRDDLWFSKNSVSMVFDWVTYNGNYDYFAYNYVKFNLLSTGKLTSDFKTKGVPINFIRGGNWNETKRIITMALFTLYGLFVLYFLTKVLRDLNAERVRMRNAGEGGIRFVLVYYKSFWNGADTLSQILSILSLINFIDYLVTPFRLEYKFSVNALDKYAVPNAAVQKYGMLKEDNPSRGLQDDWFIFNSFETLASKFETLLNIAALNSFFISIRVVKHVNTLSFVKVYSGTLSSGLPRQQYFFFVILLLLAGWALFFMIIFGNVDSNFSNLGISFTSLFMWILGNFDLTAMLDENKVIAIVFFVIYQILMNFVSINMFLATMLNTYADTVGQNEIDKEKEKLRKDSEAKYTLVEYKDKEAFKRDITAIDVDPDTREVYVKNRSKDGQAEQRNIREGGLLAGGHQICKVNGQRDGWNHYDTIQEIYDIGIAEDGRDRVVRIIFKESEPEKKGCAEFFGQLFGADEKEVSAQDIKPTVKGFWRKFGAVTQIHAEVQKSVQLSTDLDLGGDEDEGDEESDDGPGDGNGEKGKSAALARVVKSQVKRRLANLLFSRKVVLPNQDDTVDPFDLADREEDSFKDPDEMKTEDELAIDDIRNIIETEHIQGWEVWLDCLISQIELEPEMDEECIVTEVLRTSEMQDLHKSKARGAGKDVLQSFWNHASDVLSTLEFKAKKKYYEKLKNESNDRFKMFNDQNKVLHEYACELEKEFTRIMENIHKYRAKKDVMRTKLAGLLDKDSDAYKHLDTSGEQEDRSHMARFTPWETPAIGAGNADETNV